MKSAGIPSPDLISSYGRKSGLWKSHSFLHRFLPYYERVKMLSIDFLRVIRGFTMNSQDILNYSVSSHGGCWVMEKNKTSFMSYLKALDWQVVWQTPMSQSESSSEPSIIPHPRLESSQHLLHSRKFHTALCSHLTSSLFFQLRHQQIQQLFRALNEASWMPQDQLLRWPKPSSRPIPSSGSFTPHIYDWLHLYQIFLTLFPFTSQDVWKTTLSFCGQKFKG